MIIFQGQVVVFRTCFELPVIREFLYYALGHDLHLVNSYFI